MTVGRLLAQDGMSDAWEWRRGLDPTDADDRTDRFRRHGVDA